MGSGDVNDTHMKGTVLDDLVKVADLGDPVLPTGHAELHATGLAAIGDLRDEVMKAQNGAAAVALISRAMSIEATMVAIGIAYQHRPSAITGALGEMRTIRGLSKVVGDLEKEIRRQAKLASEQEQKREERYNGVVLDRLLEPLGVKGVKAPKGWRIDADDGVVAPDNTNVCPRPLVVLGSSQDVDTGLVRLHLAWQTPRGWVDKHVLRSIALNHRKVTELLDHEAPLSSNTASSVVKYITDFESENAFLSVRSTAHMGWINDDTFLHGRTPIGEDMFLAADDTVRQVVDGFAAGGTWEGWKQAVADDVVDRPMVLAGIYVSCASALLRILDRPGFLFEWSGLSSRGKTTALTIAASVWGCPTTRGLIGKWNAAGISGFLTTAWLLQSMPLLLDETKEANPDTVRQIMYTHVSGKDRTRATPTGGLRHTNTWTSVLMSTGEAPITSFSKDQGARARCICLNGPPFGDDTPENREASNRVVERLLEHHGHLGPRFVAHLLAKKGEWVRLRSRFKALALKYADMGGTAMSRRLLEHVAVIQLTADILHQDLGLPGSSAEAMKVLVQVIRDAEPAADLPALAADDLYSWAAANESRFWKRKGGRVPEPQGGFIGRWDDGDEWEQIGFLPVEVEKKLKEWGYDVSSILNAWSQRGWRVHGPEGRNPNYGKGSARLLVLKRTAFKGA